MLVSSAEQQLRIETLEVLVHNLNEVLIYFAALVDTELFKNTEYYVSEEFDDVMQQYYNNQRALGGYQVRPGDPRQLMCNSISAYKDYKLNAISFPTETPQ